jgi:hypothetical protein
MAASSTMSVAYSWTRRSAIGCSSTRGAAGPGVSRLEQLATDELMDIPDGWWALLERYLAAGDRTASRIDKEK